MFDIENDIFRFSILPYERIPQPEIDPVENTWDWIQAWIEFSLDGVQIQYKTAFTVGELMMLKEQLSEI